MNPYALGGKSIHNTLMLSALALLLIAGTDAALVGVPCTMHGHRVVARSTGLCMTSKDDVAPPSKATTQEEKEPQSTFGKKAYVTDKPSEDAAITCFMVPDGYLEGDEDGKDQWICSERSALWQSTSDTNEEDSY